jgi:c-di-GMP-binding flagellar brake protein YcgR
MDTKKENTLQAVRVDERKIIRCNAVVYLKNSRPLKARTVDISTSGMCIMTVENVAHNQMCGISFETPVNGTLVKVEAVAKVVYSICVGRDGFRLGLQFSNLDANSQAALERILG